MKPSSSDESELQVSIVGVAYNSPAESMQFLTDVASLSPSGAYACVVVENGEGPASIGQTNSVYHVGAPTNLGYFGGASYGIRLLEDRGIVTPWYVISNVDVRIHTTELACLLSKISPTVGVVAPSIVGTMGQQSNPYIRRRPRRLRLLMTEVAFGSPITNRLLLALHRVHRSAGLVTLMKRRRRRRTSFVPEANGTFIYAAHGSIVCLRRSLVVETELLRRAPFLYGEELFVAEEARRLSLTTQFVPQLKTEHTGGVSTSHLARRVQLKALKSSVRAMRRQYWS